VVAGGLFAAVWIGSHPSGESLVDDSPLDPEVTCAIEGAYGDPRYDIVAVAARDVGVEWAASANVRCHDEGP